MKFSRLAAAAVTLTLAPALFALPAHKTHSPFVSATPQSRGKLKPRAADDVYPTATPIYVIGATSTDAGFPIGSVIQAKDGLFYGVDLMGGFYSSGAIYSFTTAGNYKVVYSFPTGASVNSALTEGSDGNLYGEYTDINSNNLAFAFNIARGNVIFTVPITGLATSGFEPDGQGNLYGVTQNGGTNSEGSIFKLTFTNSVPQVAPTLSTIFSFNELSTGGSPEYPPVVASNGLLYGSTIAGCPSREPEVRPAASGRPDDDSTSGLVYSLDPSTSSFQIIGCFQFDIPESDPTSPLAEAFDGNLYGFAQASTEDSGLGGIYSVNVSSNTLSDIYEAPTGGPTAPVSFAPFTDDEGNLLVPSESGGSQSDGLLADVTTGGDEIDLHTFSSTDPAGRTLFGAATFGNDGNIYGATALGGTDNHGTIYTIAAGATPMITLTPGATTVLANGTFMLSWNVKNAFSISAAACYATSSDSLFSGSVATSGSTTIQPPHPGTHTYGLTCGGVESATATVNVQAGTIAVTDNNGNPVGSYNFGAIPENSDAPAYAITVTNNSNDAFPFSVTKSGSTSNHFSENDSCAGSIAAGASCNVAFYYTAPASAQDDSAAFQIAPHGYTFSPGSSTFYLYAHASAPGVITLSATDHSYGTVSVGSNDSYTFKVYNGTGATQAFSLSGTVVKGGTNQGSTSTTCASTLAVDASCTVTYLYSPASPGAYEYDLKVTTPATVKPVNIVKLTATAS